VRESGGSERRRRIMLCDNRTGYSNVACRIAVGLHLPGLRKSNQKEIINNINNKSGMPGATVKPLGKNLKPGWKVSWITRTMATRFIPSVESFTIFEQCCEKPFIVLWAIAFPTNKKLITTSARSRVDDASNFVFLKTIWCHDRARPGMHPGRK
jgi:hypothetical protein